MSNSISCSVSVYYFLYYLTSIQMRHHTKVGPWQLSLKVPNIDVRFLLYLYLLTKPNSEIKNMSPYHSVQMSTQSQIRLRCIC